VEIPVEIDKKDCAFAATEEKIKIIWMVKMRRIFISNICKQAIYKKLFALFIDH
jgi:hypothetical protein